MANNFPPVQSDVSDRRSFLKSATSAVALPIMVGTSSFIERSASQQTSYDHYNIEDFGARGNGVQNCQSAIQKAIDTCSERGGGTVYVPPGQFKTGTIHLKSHVHLFVDSGATLFGSNDTADYDVRLPTDHVPRDHWGSALILAESQEHVTLSGQGTIRGGGFGRPDRENAPFRPRLIAFERCRHVHIEGLTLQDPDRWTVHIYQCDHALVRGLGIFAELDVLNTDGVDVDGSSNVTISDCDITVGDDCIVIKSTDYLGPARACKNIAVTNCNLATRASGFKIGTETHADIENIEFSNSAIYVTQGVRPHDGIALETVDGAQLRGVTVSNITMQGVDAPLFLRLGNRGRRQEHPVPGILRDVVISSVVATEATVTSNVTGLPGHCVENISLSDIHISTQGGAGRELAEREIEERPADYPQAAMFGSLPAHGLFVRHVRGLTLRNVNIELEQPDERPVFVADDTADLHIDSLASDPIAQPEHLIRLRNVRSANLRGMLPPEGTRTWVHVEGQDSYRIVLTLDSVRSVQTPVSRADEVSSTAVQLKV